MKDKFSQRMKCLAHQDPAFVIKVTGVCVLEQEAEAHSLNPTQ